MLVLASDAGVKTDSILTTFSSRSSAWLLPHTCIYTRSLKKAGGTPVYSRRSILTTSSSRSSAWLLPYTCIYTHSLKGWWYSSIPFLQNTKVEHPFIIAVESVQGMIAAERSTLAQSE